MKAWGKIFFALLLVLIVGLSIENPILNIPRWSEIAKDLENVEETNFTTSSQNASRKETNFTTYIVEASQNMSKNVEAKIINMSDSDTWRPKLTDFLGISNWRRMADFHYGRLPVPQGIQRKFVTQENARSLPPRSVIQVDLSDQHGFFTTIHPLITVPYIVISIDSDYSCPGKYKPEISFALQSTTLIKLYGGNCDEHPSSYGNGKYECLPLGFSQWPQHMQPSLVEPLFVSGELTTVPFPRNGTDQNRTILLNFLMSLNAKVRDSRSRAWTNFCEEPKDLELKQKTFCKNTYKRNEKMTTEQIFNEYRRSKFVVSPEGAGRDCYRTWEALYAGAIVIVESSNMDISVYEGLPVLSVSNWTDVTLEFLNKIYSEYTQRSWNFRRLYIPWWREKFAMDFENAAK